VNAGFAAVAFVSFVFPRFTNVGGKLCLLILLLVVVDIGLVLRDLFRSGTRVRAVIAVLLWLPIVFLFAMIMQWEGPLYVAASGNPPMFKARGLAGLCGVDIYGPEQENAEWYGDDIGLLWSINHTVRFPFEAKFKYGEVPSGFAQVAPGGKMSPPPLDPNVTYKLVIGRVYYWKWGLKGSIERARKWRNCRHCGLTQDAQPTELLLQGRLIASDPLLVQASFFASSHLRPSSRTPAVA
jgi:hypothetical protein